MGIRSWFLAVCLFVLLVIGGCVSSEVNVSECQPEAISTQVYSTPSGEVYSIVWIDDDCDGECNGAVVLQLLPGESKPGKPVFEPLGVVSCEEADSFHQKAELRKKKRMGV